MKFTILLLSSLYYHVSIQIACCLLLIADSTSSFILTSRPASCSFARNGLDEAYSNKQGSTSCASTWTNGRRGRDTFTFLHESTTDEEKEESASTAILVLDGITQMKVREIKNELDQAGISTSDCFEKDDLIQRLYKYKLENKDESKSKKSQSNVDSEPSTTSSKERNNYNNSNNSNNNSNNDTSTIRVPMDFHSLTTKSIKSNSNLFIRPSPGKFPSITVTLPTKGNKQLNLLVDTACSGVILRPKVSRELKLPNINTGVTMTAAGGSVGATDVCRLDSLQLSDARKTTLTDFIVVGQDIGALPPILDGIIGLSFLERFTSVSFDFESGQLILKENSKSISEYLNPMEYDVMAETLLQRSRLGIYVAPITLDGRGPVKMIVDTGAASTFLNWKGVSDMNMDRNHPLVSYNREAIGVMGADNNALALTHRFSLKRRMNFDSSASGGTIGMFNSGLDITEFQQRNGDNADSSNQEMNIDIGDLPVLEAMKSEDVGGILGSDLLMRCDVVHFDNLKDLSSLKVSLLKKKCD